MAASSRGQKPEVLAGLLPGGREGRAVPGSSRCLLARALLCACVPLVSLFKSQSPLLMRHQS